MGSDQADSLTITLDDLHQHVVRYGLDVFPPIDVRNEITRAHDLFQNLQEQWPDFYQEINFRPQSSEFRILTTYSLDGGSAKVPTFSLTNRGPVFRFPLRLHDLGDLNQDKDLDQILLGSLGLTRKTFPGLQILRIGLVRELVFGTGKTPSIPYISSRVGSFPGATPRGGNLLALFHDSRCNIRVRVQSIEIHRRARTPTRQVLSDELEYGLQVEFDVNNIEMKPQSDTELETTLQRAHSLWPKGLLEYINWSKTPS